jgi:hypothetical protein
VKTVTVDVAAINRLATEQGGAISLALEETAQAFVEDAKQTLSIDAIPAGWATVRLQRGAIRRVRTYFPNPPPGPPRRRTGDLVDSIKWTRDGTGPEVYVVSDPTTQINFHDDFLYSKWLRDQGYKFLSFELPETFH